METLREGSISQRELCSNALRDFRQSTKGRIVENPESYLTNHAKNDRSVDPSKYRFETHTLGELMDSPINVDANNVIALYDSSHKGEEILPIAFAAFELESLHFGPSSVVYQLQAGSEGRTAFNPLLGDIRWEVMFLRMISDWSKQNDFACASIPADKCYWFQRGYELANLRNQSLCLEDFQANLKRRYDGAARRAKFSKDEVTKLWVDKTTIPNYLS